MPPLSAIQILSKALQDRQAMEAQAFLEPVQQRVNQSTSDPEAVPSNRALEPQVQLNPLPTNEQVMADRFNAFLRVMSQAQLGRSI